MLNEKILMNYRRKKEYLVNPLNAVGATTSTTLRTVTTGTALTNKYVRKFGDAWMIKSVSAITDPVDADLTYGVYALDGTLLGSRVGGGAFVAGATLAVAQASYIKVTATGTGTVLTAIAVTSDVEALTFVCPAEVLTIGMTINLYLSSTTSTYYDSGLVYGGARHTPDGSIGLPFFTITAGLAALTGDFVICEVLDSAIYDEELTISGAFTLQASLGQTPTITCGIGARVTRTVQHDGNNLDTAYVSKLGNDSTGTGTWALPYLTIGQAITSIGARTYINIKDSGTYVENNTIASALTVEPVYGQIATVTKLGDHVFTLTHTGAGIYGLIISGDNTLNKYGVYVNCAWSNNIKNNTINKTHTGVFIITGNIFSGLIGLNKIYSCTRGVYLQTVANTSSGEVLKNTVYACADGILVYFSGTVSTKINNNTVMLNSGTGIACSTSGNTFNGEINNNTVIYNYNGIGVSNNGGVFSGSFSKNIVYGNSNVDIYDSFVSGISVTYTNYGTNGGLTIGAGCITTDPQFIDTTSNNYALKIGSGAYKTDGAEGDMGAILGNILISSSTVTINGFIFDGQNKYFKAIYKTGSTDYSALSVKWCTVKNYQGMAIDDYSGAATLGSFINNIIKNNGEGLNIPKGATLIQYDLIFGNIVHNIYTNGAITTFDHNVLFGGAYGLYVATSGSVDSFKNSITYQNTSYGVYSVTAGIAVLNSDINDNYNSNVDVSDLSNLNVNPLFISTVSGAEDFGLKCSELGALYNSALIGMADDGYDMGAYLVTRAVSGYSWRKYLFEHNGMKADFADSMKGINAVVGANGHTSIYGYGEKRTVKISWPVNQYVTETLRKKIQYFGTLIKTRANGFTEDQTIFRVHFLPDQFIATGTGTIDATAKTIADSTKQWVENEHRGWHVGVKFTSGTGLVIDATAKTGTKSGAGWTTDQWTGYYFYYLGYYYYIVSNTSDALTFLDPDATLTNTTVDFAVEKYFKVLSNTENVLYLSDPDGELSDGSLGYYIDFIEMKVIDPKFSYSQPRYYYQQETWKNGFDLVLEEV